MATKKKAAKKKAAPKKGALSVASKNTDDLHDHEGGENNVSTAGKSTSDLYDELKGKKAAKMAGTQTINKVKVDQKDHLEVSVSTIEADGSITNNNKTMSRPCHPDLKKALQEIAVHWCILNDYLSVRAVKDPNYYDVELVDGVRVTCLSIGGKPGEEGIKITAVKTSRRGKAIVTNTPFERFEEVEESRYKYMDDLQKKIDLVMKETALYLTGEKMGESPQQEIEFPEDGGGEEEEQDNDVGGDHDEEM